MKICCKVALLNFTMVLVVGLFAKLCLTPVTPWTVAH